jgi:hypothetical protein
LTSNWCAAAFAASDIETPAGGKSGARALVRDALEKGNPRTRRAFSRRDAV